MLVQVDVLQVVAVCEPPTVKLLGESRDANTTGGSCTFTTDSLCADLNVALSSCDSGGWTIACDSLTGDSDWTVASGSFNLDSG